MFVVSNIQGSSFRVSLPEWREKVALLALGRAFVRYEGGLPAEAQTPFAAAIQTAVSEASAAFAAREVAESERKAASEALKRAEVATTTAVHQIRSLLEGYYAQTPERAQAWGFIVRQTGSSAGKVLLPRYQSGMNAALNQYVETELSRPEAERFTLPPLADMVTLRDALAQLRLERDQATQRRLQANALLNKRCRHLAAYLRQALGYLVLFRYEGQVSRDLGEWGFHVTERVAGGSDTAVPAPVEAEPAAVLPA